MIDAFARDILQSNSSTEHWLIPLGCQYRDNVMWPVGVNLQKQDGRVGVIWRLMQQGGGGQEGLHEMRGHINLTPHHWSRHVRKNWQSLWGFVHTLAY